MSSERRSRRRRPEPLQSRQRRLTRNLLELCVPAWEQPTAQPPPSPTFCRLGPALELGVRLGSRVSWGG